MVERTGDGDGSHDPEDGSGATHDPDERLAERGSLPRLAPTAGRYVLPPAVVGLSALFVFPVAGVGLVILAVLVALFFRDPARDPPPSGWVCPADGTVSVVRVEDHEGEERVRVGVFMNVTDVHVVRAPADASVDAVDHSPGANRPAFTKDSDRNERVTMATDSYDQALVAGWFARRIHPYVEPGDDVARGGRVGHIAFGSRVDVVLPAEYGVDDVAVAEGESVRAGETVLVADDVDRADD